ncbi:ribonuclease P Rpr2/Rpp21/SNM1 subunit [Aspergillus ruber CBS 135680]|uniref:Rpr2-domain-containing protein n=1 Tax=Aspergillus ruber (strain CBS 135680) TaxID=1388766 RepID=A0A017SKX1_ASPRC|nr:Rpr2-domain-containing protein [Aspergillus ruber CBS 135680]EYE96960.1 Rpr2-domain-containing protein [Aspergillus ruber CBS 135680]
MAKGKGKNVNSHLRARLDYLHKAAAYLHSTTIASKQQQTQQSKTENNASDGKCEVGAGSNRTVPQILSPGSTAVAVEEASGSVNQKQEPNLDRLPNLSRAYISQLRGISLKTQLRLPQEVKRSFCKRCDTLLVPGVSCMREIRNTSREGKKPWADVRVVRCTTCGTEKQYPQAENRSKKLAERKKEQEQRGRQIAET